KVQLAEGLKKLKDQEISEADQKQVEARIKNIVIGHKNNYTNEIEHFLQSLSGPVFEKEHFSSREDYKEAIVFTEKLNHSLDQLAKRTAKSYQAAQHLFFDHVEHLFKLLKELNKLIKGFEIKVKENKINDLEKLFEEVFILTEEIQKKNNLTQEIKIKEKKLSELKKENETETKNLKKLESSPEFEKFLELKKEEEKLIQEIKEEEHKVFSFFFKLSKALKKYERIALENKIIKQYLEDYLGAFRKDPELEIVRALSSLKKGLDSLNFDEKQKKNFLELIEKAEQGYLQKISVQIKELDEKKEGLNEKINKNLSPEKIKEKKKEINNLTLSIAATIEGLDNFKSILEKINLENSRKEISRKIKEILKKEINLNLNLD
ncbi:MAG: hypothetical protein KJ598_04225, partial [Nanoarchaeota archaeon]|nr:hypothetical protein [Nanoarchaeota archaeon]MBU1644337.1 hypothetical protein [Nanoarchaeota archaeon]